MKLKQPLSAFLRECLNYQITITSWGISQIKIVESQVSFHVYGFNFCGLITITIGVEEDSLILNSSNGFIGKFTNPIKAISALDKYIELNPLQYNKLFNHRK